VSKDLSDFTTADNLAIQEDLENLKKQLAQLELRVKALENRSLEIREIIEQLTRIANAVELSAKIKREYAEKMKEKEKKRRDEVFNAESYIAENPELELIKTSKSLILKPKSFLGKETWRKFNDELKTHGFEWKSAGKDSCWFKELEGK